MIPLVAAAPALAHTVLRFGRRGEGAPQRPDLGATALANVAGLDALAPCEPVLILDRHGNVLAASGAARAALRMLPSAFECHASAIFAVEDIDGLADAIDRCWANGRATDVELNADCGRVAGRLSTCSDGTVALRIVEGAPSVKASKLLAARVKEPHFALAVEPATTICSDIADAVAFALRRAEMKAADRRIALTIESEPGLVVACDRQAARRIASQLIDLALNGSDDGASVKVTARRCKGVVLLRAASSAERDAAHANESACGVLDPTRLRALVEQTGGTLIVHQDGHDIALSIRLNLATEE
jgi:hypothetical protein